MEATPPAGVFRQQLCQAVGEERYSVWFDDAVEVHAEGTQLRLTAPTVFHRERLRTQFREAISAAAAKACGTACKVEYLVAAEVEGAQVVDKPRSRSKRTIREASAKPRVTPVAVDPLAGWVETPSAAEAVTACRGVVSGRLTASPLLLWGAPGVGKTHLLRAVADGVRQRDRSRRVLIVTAEQFVVGFVAALRGSGLPNFRAKHREIDLLLLDNAHQLVGKERTTEEFLHTIDALVARGGQVVMTSDRSPSELAQLGPELASRLAGGVTAPLRMPDSAGRVGLVQQAAAERGIELSPLACQTLAATLQGGAREVAGAMNRIALLHETFQSPLDDDLMRRVAREINQLSAPRVGIDQIEMAVCEVFGVGTKELRSDKRTKAVSEPRMLAMWLARKLTGSAWSEIGDHFGRRSHSTVIAAHHRVERLLASDNPPRLAGQAGDLHEAIRRVESTLRLA
ncbi:DnaA ATPase domain-containing protein [Botrimarina hoheduenensis]|uniref:Chromosomal replication initiator protein DnaA n=1 Tax=Botrimarina hoheduenensis TaxID=2528000 RepID=A0A5C5VYM2_9BACT|nr:DnaA/Hda family protein [Botrimarina hoheduenensis]TWT42849.1 Chromosomal replication initiator protein DnaA [Botrimarina hoheduenensis]